MSGIVDFYNDIFKFNGKRLIVIVDKSNIPWFYKQNILKVLGYKHDTGSIREYISQRNRKTYEELYTYALYEYPIAKNSVFISENGMYELLSKSRKPKAEEFLEWLTDDVLPKLRKTGSYKIVDSLQKELKKRMINLMNINKK